MQISFVQEMILFINSIICTPNSDNKIYSVERLVQQFHEHFYFYTAPITKNVQYCTRPGFESEPINLSMSPLQLSLEHGGFPSVGSRGQACPVKSWKLVWRSIEQGRAHRIRNSRARRSGPIIHTFHKQWWQMSTTNGRLFSYAYLPPLLRKSEEKRE